MPSIFHDEDHTEIIMQKLRLQRKHEEFCDLVLIAGAEALRIPAHRNILSAASEYFNVMFTSAMLESTLREIKLPAMHGEVLRSLIEYIYTGSVEIIERNVVELLKTADVLLLAKVVAACENFIANELHPSNCFGFALLAEQYHFQTLLQTAKIYCLEHFMDACTTDEFLNLNAQQLSEILSSDNLCVSSEEDVFNSLLTWIQHDRLEREKYKADLLQLVRFPLLERSFLFENVDKICTSNECLQFYMRATELKLSPAFNIKSRKNSSFMLAITLNKTLRKMFIQYYCPQSLKWLKWMNALELRKAFGVSVMEDQLFIVGGHDNLNNNLNSVLCLNLKTMILSHIKPMIEKRQRCRAAVLKGYLYALGGLNLSSVEKWYPSNDAWSYVASMSVDRCSFGSAILNDKLFVVGGISNGCIVNSAEYYDPQCNVWRPIKAMNRKRLLPGVAVANGLLYAVGGFKDNTVERYDPQTNSWTMLCSLRETCTQTCITFRNKVVICYRDRIEEYDAIADEWIAKSSLNAIECIYRLFSCSQRPLLLEFLEN